MNRSEQRTVLEAFSKTLTREAHNLTQRPDILWQQMYNRLQWADGENKDGQVTKAIELEFQKRTAPGTKPWFHQTNRVKESEALMRTLKGHTGSVNSCAFSPDVNRRRSVKIQNFKFLFYFHFAICNLNFRERQLKWV